MMHNQARKFGPKTNESESINEPCVACHKPLKVGDFTCLISLGPGDDEEERKLARAGRPYVSVAAEIHWECSDYISYEDYK